MRVILGEMNMDIFNTYARLLSSENDAGELVFQGMNEMEEQLIQGRPSATGGRRGS